MRCAAILIFLLHVSPVQAQSFSSVYRANLEYCAGLNVRKFDDGISSAALIARALLGFL